jgi:ABC-type sugar transport system substrate-binding protein
VSTIAVVLSTLPSMRRIARRAPLAGLLAAFAVGCGNGGDDSGEREPDARLAAVIKGLDNPFFATMRDGLVATARRHRARLRVDAAAGLEDTAGQAATLESAAAERDACYVVNPITRTNLIQPLSHLPRGTPVVNVDSPVDQTAAKAVGVSIKTYIGTDNAAAGRLAADAMARLVAPGARVVVIAGIPGDATSGARVDGFRRGARGRFDVAGTVAADFDRDRARLAAADLLRNRPHPAGFFAVNDEMALGVADAVRDAGRRGEVAVIGMDGIREALAAVRRGTMSATVAQYPFTIGRLGVEACLAAIAGERLPATVDAPVQVVTSENVARAEANFPQPAERFADPLARLLAG